mmetsp:Transcript_25762/g.69891  ORF Transcript_25762/g.69891 Transcript_25762/m.69891 type:complete len:285 (-) Transcript_25762:149-1003(-)|eukprot:315697-Pelagomonas_calceolata.AAC.4
MRQRVCTSYSLVALHKCPPATYFCEGTYKKCAHHAAWSKPKCAAPFPPSARAPKTASQASMHTCTHSSSRYTMHSHPPMHVHAQLRSILHFLQDYHNIAYLPFEPPASTETDLDTVQRSCLCTSAPASAHTDMHTHTQMHTRAHNDTQIHSYALMLKHRRQCTKLEHDARNAWQLRCMRRSAPSTGLHRQLCTAMHSGSGVAKPQTMHKARTCQDSSAPRKQAPETTHTYTYTHTQTSESCTQLNQARTQQCSHAAKRQIKFQESTAPTTHTHTHTCQGACAHS